MESKINDKFGHALERFLIEGHNRTSANIIAVYLEEIRGFNKNQMKQHACEWWKQAEPFFVQISNNSIELFETEDCPILLQKLCVPEILAEATNGDGSPESIQEYKTNVWGHILFLMTQSKIISQTESPYATFPPPQIDDKFKTTECEDEDEDEDVTCSGNGSMPDLLKQVMNIFPADVMSQIQSSAARLQGENIPQEELTQRLFFETMKIMPSLMSQFKQ